MKPQHVFAGEQRRNRFRVARRRLRDHGHLFVLRQVVNHDVEHEAVELRFGQRVGAFHFNRVLRGEHEKRFRQRVTDARGGDLMFLHGFEQRRLGFRRGAIDFVGQNHVGKNRAGHERHGPSAGGLLENFRAGNVRRHEIGRELDALKSEVENLREGLDQKCFGQAGRAGDQTMAAGEERDQELFDDLFLADDDPGEFRLNARAPGEDLFDQMFFSRLRVGCGFMGFLSTAFL